LSDDVGRAKPGRNIGVLLVPAAAAVAVSLVLVRLHFQPPTVPAYTLAKGSSEGALERGSSFELVIEPDAPVQGAVGARAFLLRGNEARAWEPPSSVGQDGSIRIAGPVDQLFAGVPAGDWEVAVAVGRPETLPTVPRDVALARNADPATTSPRAWRLVRESVRLGN
jgi:hypothetical protein